MSFQFTPDYIYAPDASLEITDWRFSEDLRQFFPKLKSNHEIGDLLTKRKIVTRQKQLDSAGNATFKTERAAMAFLKRLNAMPEVKNYTEPKPKTLVAMAEDDWKLLRHTLYEMLTPKQYKKLQKLDIELHCIEDYMEEE